VASAMLNFAINIASTNRQDNFSGVSQEELTALILQHQDHSELQKKWIARLECDLDLNQRQIRAALDILGEVNVPAERLAAKLVEIAERFKALISIAEGQPGDSLEIATLKAEAQKAIAEGELVRADALLADVEAEQKRAFDRLALTVADTCARRGEIALARLRYGEAAGHYAKAASVLLPASAYEEERLGYLEREALALSQQGTEFGDNDALLSAIARYGRLVELKERTRRRAPLEWALMQNNLGAARCTLGERESGIARLTDAVEAFEKALEERTRERAPLDWIVTQNNLGVALWRLGERESGTARLQEAVDVYYETLEEQTEERAHIDWATTQHNLGTVLSTLGERKRDVKLLRGAINFFDEALKKRNRERAPLEWAMSQNNLGSALVRLGELENDEVSFSKAIDAYHAALQERTRARAPLYWAATQNNLGNALMSAGERESGTARFEEAVDAYNEALKERTRPRVPLEWATTQNNLGTAFHRLAERESGIEHLNKAIEAYREALKVRTRARVPLDWAVTRNNLDIAKQLLAQRRKQNSEERRRNSA
jgi:tetratricopeptide (TPR) repeat protein